MRGTPARRQGFTIIELLVVVAIIGLLIAILLPAIGKAKDQAKLTQSLSNLRNLGTAHGSYAAEWNDRQFSLIDDNIASYSSTPDTAFANYRTSHGGISHPGVVLGWGYERDANGIPEGYKYFEWDTTGGHPETRGMVQPIVFHTGSWTGRYFGSFRLVNCAQFHNYVGGRYYDPTFFAPKDDIPIEWVGRKGCWEDPGEFCATHQSMLVLQKPIWCTYILSPAAMFSPDVMRSVPEGGWQWPWLLQGGFRSPAFGMCLYPALKTHMLEHHWLQARATDCNPGFSPGTYDNCEPYYFNHAWESSPATLFYDGHVETVGVRKAERADGRNIAQTGYGLWSRDTMFGADGYHIGLGYDQANTSFHILTTNGIRGRDIVAD